MTDTSSFPRLAYVTSLYPAASHTFILREITALEKLGFEILPCSIREPDAAHLIGPEEQAATAKTFYVLNEAKRLKTLPRAILSAFKSPKALFETLKLAFRTPPPGLRGALKQTFYFAEALVLSDQLQRQNIDHIHNHFADHSANVSMLTSALSGIPFSYTLHGPNELFEANKWYFDEKTARAKFVACISHFARSQAMYFSDPIHWHKLKIIHCGVVPERYLQAKSQTQKPRLLFIGRLTAVKGVRVLLGAFKDALEKNPDLHLDIIGDGEDRAHLQDMAQSITKNVTFHGYKSQEEVADALAKADALVLPSFAEGLPVVLMEALASGTPVICSQVAGVAELVENGKSGFIIPAGDSETLTKRMLDIAGDTEKAAQMGVFGQARVQAEFNINIEAARIGRLFSGDMQGALRPDPLSAEPDPQ